MKNFRTITALLLAAALALALYGCGKKDKNRAADENARHDILAEATQRPHPEPELEPDDLSNAPTPAPTAEPAPTSEPANDAQADEAPVNDGAADNGSISDNSSVPDNESVADNAEDQAPQFPVFAGELIGDDFD